jgi:hypothetical protein
MAWVRDLTRKKAWSRGHSSYFALAGQVIGPLTETLVHPTTATMTDLAN